MNKKILIGLAVMALALALVGCDNGSGGSQELGLTRADGASSIDEIQGIDWLLLEVRGASGTVAIDRSGPGSQGMYVLRFEEERLSGAAAPNLYFGPYTSGDGNALSIEEIASTQMALLPEREDLIEDEYLAYLLRVSRWDLAEGKLELFSSCQDGEEAVLVFLAAPLD